MSGTKVPRYAPRYVPCDVPGYVLRDVPGYVLRYIPRYVSGATPTQAVSGIDAIPGGRFARAGV